MGETGTYKEEEAARLRLGSRWVNNSVTFKTDVDSGVSGLYLGDGQELEEMQRRPPMHGSAFILSYVAQCWSNLMYLQATKPREPNLPGRCLSLS